MSEVPIAVPGYHRLEPGIKLVYSSTGMNGWTGTGWSLAGASAVERHSPGGGAPRYDAADAYFLDGMELIPCTLQGGTHCTKIQSYSRIVQDKTANRWYVWSTLGVKSTYAPVSATNTTYKWALASVQDTHGNIVSYNYWCDSGYDCYLDSITYNGTVVKFYSELRPDPILYATGGRPGVTTMAGPVSASPISSQVVVHPDQICADCGGDDGGGGGGGGGGGTTPPPAAPLTTMRYRLKTIDVTVGGERARSYKLSYTQSTATGRSLLTSVQVFGRDAVLDAAGTVMGGTSVPGSTYTYSTNGATSPVAYGTAAGPSVYVAGDSKASGVCAGGVMAADFSGDGRDDMLVMPLPAPSGNGTMQIYVSRADGGFNGPFTGPAFSYFANPFGWSGYGKVATARLKPGDFNGDGKIDIAYVNGWGASAETTTYLSNGDGTFRTVPSGIWRYVGNSGVDGAMLDLSRVMTGDFNGDGKTDLAAVEGWNVATNMSIYLSNGDGTFRSMSTGPYRFVGDATDKAQADVSRIKVGDFDGDGKTDFAAVEGWGYSTNMTIYRSNGDGTFGYATTGPLRYVGDTGGKASIDTSRVVTGDFNGDGKTDFAAVEGWGAWANMTIYLSVGDGTFATYTTGPNHYVGTDQTASVDTSRVRLGDYDGDGRTDIGFVEGWNSTSNMTISLSNGDGTFRNYYTGPARKVAGDADTAASDISRVKAGDFNGDGKTDLAAVEGWGTTQAMSIFTMSGGAVDLLQRQTNGVGGDISIRYTPSSAWSNTFMPTGMILQTIAAETISDGRGNSSTTTYRYEGGLFSLQDRAFLGFRKVTAVVNAAGDYTETYYHQRVGSISKPDVTYFRDAGGRIYSYSQYQYAENTAAPYTSLLTDRWEYECNLTTACRRILTQFGYDAYGNVTTVDEWGNYDVQGDERTTSRGYYPNSSLYIMGLPAYENLYAGIGTTGQPLRQFLYQYDGNATYTAAPTKGDLTKTLSWDNWSGGYVTRSTGYDAYGNPILETDERGNSATTDFDPVYHAYAVRKQNAAGHVSTLVWDYVIGEVTASTDANGAVTTYTYDPLGRLRQVASPNGAVVRMDYYDVGNPNAQRIRETRVDGSADGLWSDAYQDGLGRVYKSVKKGGFTMETVFSDGSARKWKESGWYGPGETPVWTTYAYDGAGRVRRVTSPDGTYAEVVYGSTALGLAADGFNAGSIYTAKFDELGNERVTWNDAYGNAVQIREKDGTAYAYTVYQYDVKGDLIQGTDAAGNVSTFTYDSLGRKRSACDPDMGCWSYAYDAGGLPTAKTDASGLRTTYVYDSIGRLTETDLPDGTKAQSFWDEAGYGNSRGKLTRAIYPGGSESHTYDSVGNETVTAYCVETTCKTIRKGFDTVGRLSTVTYPDGEVVSYTYDQTGRLYSVGGYVTSLSWTARDQIAAMTDSNGTTSRYSYDPNREWLTGLSVTGPGGVVLFQSTYGYDAAAKVTATSSTTNPASNMSYGYDSLGRLTTVSGALTQNLTYNAVGNILSNSTTGSYSYTDSAHKHAVTQAGNNTYAYDANGNMTSGAGRTYTWDAENRLITATVNGQTTSFAYDGGERRILKRGPQGTTYYMGPLVEVENGSLVKYYYAGPILVARRDATGATWYHSDRLGSVRLLTNSAGQKVDGYDYAPFGAALGSSTPSGRGFGGHQTDAETGLIYMGARYYDPVLGRFLSPDTIVPDPGNPQALNRYSYVYNNPLNNTDPTGHAPVAAVAVVSAIHTAIVCVATVAIAIIGAVLTTVGYLTHDPWLLSIGSTMLGFATGGMLGAAVAAITSPVSPLDSTIKQVIGWAYTAACIIATPDNLPTKDQKLGDGLKEIAKGEHQLLKHRDLAGLQKIDDGIQKVAAATGKSVEEITKWVKSTYVPGAAGLKGALNLPWQNSYWGSSAQLAYAERVAAGSNGRLTVWQAVLLNPTGGMTGPGSMSALTPFGRINMHSITHDADGFLYRMYHVGRGYAAFPHPGLFPGWAMSGQIGGLTRWIGPKIWLPIVNNSLH